jgi:hypothetical protein
MNQRIIWESDDKQYRILEIPDACAEIDDLKGDCFKPEAGMDPDAVEQLKTEERHFEELVEREGVFGYVLERWNAAPGTGYEDLDSCFGFVGSYTPTEETFNHYIVEEMRETVRLDLTRKALA